VWRYLAIATAIVAAALAVIVMLSPRSNSAVGSPRYASSRGTPGPAQHDDFRREPDAVSGDAPWALSALPGCFKQRASAAGAPAFARAKVRIPRGARAVDPGGTLRVADCTLTVRAGSALVVRGDNRLIVPAVARFYVVGDRLILDRRDGPREDLRAYTLVGGARPSFARNRSSKP